MLDMRLGYVSICKRVAGHTHWEIVFWRRGISFRFGPFVFLLTEAIFRALKQIPCHRLLHDGVSMSWLTHAAFQASRRCNGTAKVLPSVSKVAGVWRSLSWCLESVMLWRGIMGFTKFGDKRVNDLDLL